MLISRLRRLHADYASIRAAFANHPYIKLIGVEGDPPEKYAFEFNLPGLLPVDGGPPRPGNTHRAQVFLSEDYPRRPPFCRMISPVFHPNINPQRICIGDHWSAGESLTDLIVRIGEIICYQSYNVKSPLNAEAAAWTELNEARLPLLKADIAAQR